jgi:hypothetical protein
MSQILFYMRKYFLCTFLLHILSYFGIFIVFVYIFSFAFTSLSQKINMEMESILVLQFNMILLLLCNFPKGFTFCLPYRSLHLLLFLIVLYVHLICRNRNFIVIDRKDMKWKFCLFVAVKVRKMLFGWRSGGIWCRFGGWMDEHELKVNSGL